MATTTEDLAARHRTSLADEHTELCSEALRTLDVPEFCTFQGVLAREQVGAHCRGLVGAGFHTPEEIARSCAVLASVLVKRIWRN